MERSIKDIKSVKDDFNHFQLQYKDNTLMYIKKIDLRSYSFYTTYIVKKPFRTLKEVKEFCLDYFKDSINSIDNHKEK